MQGFISLHRKLMENPVWSDPYYLKLWMYCLFSASHKKHEQLVGNQIVLLERGQFVTGRFSLTEDLNKGMKPKQRLNDSTWWRHLKSLEQWGMLHIEPHSKYSLITIDKYDFYQNVFNQTAQQNEQILPINCPSTAQQLHTNNNDNKGNKGNKKEYTSDFEEFWSIYPRRKEKAKAFNCWNVRLKEEGVTSELLILCAKNYATEVKKNGTEEKFMKHPATFLGPNKPYDDYTKISTSKKTPTYEVDNQQVSDAALEAWVRNNANKGHG